MALKPHWVEDRKMTPEAIAAALEAEAKATLAAEVETPAPAKKPRGKAKKGD